MSLVELLVCLTLKVKVLWSFGTSETSSLFRVTSQRTTILNSTVVITWDRTKQYQVLVRVVRRMLGCDLKETAARFKVLRSNCPAFGTASFKKPRNRLWHFHGGSAFCFSVGFCWCGKDYWSLVTSALFFALKMKAVFCVTNDLWTTSREKQSPYFSFNI